MTDNVRMVECRKLKESLPAMKRAPYRNELGQKLFNEVSQKAWDQWLKDSVKLINTYRVDLGIASGQKFMLDQCAIYFGYQEGDLAETAWVPPPKKAESASDEG
ncbi:MAG: oxidative damage protection protein [Deltaproteobacteria bacterium]|nr:oxidative damage protection protein [Deltaproteobacteria bacterium]